MERLELENMFLRSSIKDIDDMLTEDRREWGDGVIKHLQAVEERFCEEKKNFKQDFWWIENAKSAVWYSVYARKAMSRLSAHFLDDYIEAMLLCLYKSIVSGELRYVAYIDIKHGLAKGYRSYEKENNVWVPKSYKKAPMILV